MTGLLPIVRRLAPALGVVALLGCGSDATDPSSVTEPLVFYQIKGTGAVIQ